MKLESLLDTLFVQGVELWLDNGHLRYRGPKAALTPAVLTNLKQHKNEIIAYLSQPELHPLSYGQQALWFEYQMAPDRPVYNLSLALRFRAAVNVTVLQTIFQQLVNRHATLRTTFTLDDGLPQQKIHQHQKVVIEQIDARPWSWAQLTEAVATAHKDPFDLVQGPLLRLHLFTHALEDHVFLLTTHHIVTDGLSIRLLLDELQTLHPVVQAETTLNLPPLPATYVDYVKWQSHLLQTEGDPLWRYWRQKLAGELPVLNLQTDYPRPPVWSYKGASQDVEIPADLTAALRHLARTEQTTLYTILLAAFQILLYRYTGQEDILVGTPTAGRSRPEFARLVGYFASPVVMRADLSGNPSFRTFLQQVRQTVAEALDHQDYPFPLLVEKLYQSRDPSRPPLCQAGFDFERSAPVNRPAGLPTPANGATKAARDEAAIVPFKVEQNEGVYELDLGLFETPEQLSGALKYNPDLFTPGTIQHIVGCYLTLLRGVVADPDQNIVDLPLLTKTERHQILAKWNDTQVSHASAKAVHYLFEDQVERTPDAVAIVFGDQHLTYCELNQRANQLAYTLHFHDIDGHFVGIYVERSLEMIIGLLGILKAGAAYLPLDPTYPPERLAFMISDADLSLIVSHSSLADQVQQVTSQTQQNIIWLDTLFNRLPAQPISNPLSRITPNHLAYVIYTSGSTGQPKGVMIPHRGLTNFLYSMQQQPGLQTSDILLSVTTLSFDIAALELFLPLMVGAKAILVNQSIVADGEALTDLIAASETNVMQATPATWRLLLEADWTGASHFKALCGGEALSLNLAQRLLAKVGQLWNLYGPTETTIWSSMYQVPPNPSRILLGRPIANTQIYILDHRLEPTPIGVAGELYLAGEGIALGYLGRPALTADRFIPNRFTELHPKPYVSEGEPEPGFGNSTLYKTGDLARYLPGGTIEFLGRLDDQVKLRGFRIELGEIEATLNQHPSVKESVVIARENQGDHKQLVAYLIGNENGQELMANNQSLTTTLRPYLKQKLPDYMIPTAFVRLEQWPLTPNGKINRRALPEPAQLPSQDHLPPQNATELALAQIWSEVLGLPSVGLQDNFFELGGHSLLATQAVSRIREQFQIELPLRRLFEYPQLAALAEVVAQAKQAVLRPIEPVSHEQELPLSFAQQRLWFLDQLEGANPTYNIPAALALSGHLNIPALADSFTAVVQRHEILRTTFQSVGGQAKQIIQPQASAVLAVIDLQHLAPEIQAAEVQSLTEREALHSFDLGQDLMIRAKLLLLEPKVYHLLITMHHIASDGWSIGVLVQEVIALYQACCQGLVAPLPELAIQYADFAHWQRQWLAGEVLAQQMAYWQQQLADAPPLLDLPTDHPRPAWVSYHGAHHTFHLAVDLSRDLHTLSQEAGATLYMTLLTAFKVLLYRYSGQSDLIVGSPIANRTRPEIEALIGFFVNTLAIRTDLSNQSSFLELLAQVRQVTQASYEHQDLPFEVLVDLLQPERNVGQTPLFQVMFVMQNLSQPNLDLPELSVKPLSLTVPTAKFDLILSLQLDEAGLSGDWEYKTALFEATTIKRMTGHFENLLQAIVNNPDRSISHLPLLSETEQQQLLVDWNKSKLNGQALLKDTSPCLHHLFEAQVERTPQAIAVVYEDQQLTYQELNHRANQLAHYLLARGVGPDTVIGLYLERSLQMAIGLLAILKAGGAYLPLDPTYPHQRLLFMLEDAQASLLISQSSLVDKTQLATIDQRQSTIRLDTLAAQLSQEPSHNPLPRTTAHNLAYVIYTSGSTGQPKGVMISHANVTRLFSATQARFPFNSGDVWTLFHSIAFDFSVWELWGAWLYGGRLVIVPTWVRHAPEALYHLIGDQQVTVLNQTPSAFRQLIWAEDRLEPTTDLNLRLIIFGGEALEMTTLHPWFERHGDKCPQLTNMYGITETTVHVTDRPLTQTDVKGGSVIGSPIADLELYILDQQLQPAPIGVPGEMYVAGAGVSRGYLNQPGITAERFIPHPYPQEAETSGARLYKTGDLARYLPNGDIEYLGRIDHQVKIRGFRIELGEIETVLTDHPAVETALVLLRQDEPGYPYLVAYLVSRLSTPLPITEIRHLAQQKLPSYMIPAAFVPLTDLPLTANGKIDRRALPAPDKARRDVSAAYTAPRTATEELLTDVWMHVLDLKQVGIYDNFFELGGDSMLSIQLVAQAKMRGLQLNVQDLFQHQTIYELARSISEGPISTPLTEPFGLIATEDRRSLADGIEDAYPLTALQTGMVFHSEYDPDRAVYHDIFSYHLRAPFNMAAFKTALEQLVRRHAVLRTSFVLTAFDQPLQLVHQQVDIPLAITDIQHLSEAGQEAAIDAWIAAEKKKPFVWERPPLIQFQIHRRSKTTFNLSFSCHHAILDGWSVASLITELTNRFVAILKQEELSQQPPPIAFRDFVALEQQTVTSPEAKHYWRQTLTELTVSSVPRWPMAAPLKGDGKPLPIPISSELGKELIDLAQQTGVPLKSVLLAAHLRLLSLLTNQADVVTGLVTNCRPEERGGEAMLGLFLNTIPFRLKLSGGTWLDLIQDVFAAERELLPYRRYPYIEIQHQLGDQSLFEVVFNYVHFHVFQNIKANQEEIEFLGDKVFAQNNFGLTANFSRGINANHIEFQLEYDGRLFSIDQIETIGRYYVRILAEIVRDPSGRYKHYSPLSVAEQQQILVDWNNTEVNYPVDRYLPQMFEKQVERTPHAVAVVYKGHQLTYRQLNQRANQLAHHLQSLGVGPETLVGLCLHRSPEMVISLLAILKAGGAYVPLDPSYPSDRLAFMMADAQLSIVISQSSLVSAKLLAGRLSQRTTDSKGRVIIDLDAIATWLEQEPTFNPISRLTPDNLAYVIYTSGSTGQPKGTLIAHRGLTNYLAWCLQSYQPEQGSGAPVNSALGFDATVTSLFPPLLVGKKVVLLPEAEEIEALGKILQQNADFSLVKITPAHLKLLSHLSHNRQGARSFIIGGEALFGSQVLGWRQHYPELRLVNEYGPTETVVGCCVYDVPLDFSGDGAVPIGRPIANTQLYILDQRLQPVPVGVVGELYIGGEQVARGYLNRPALTAEKFLPNPFYDNEKECRRQGERLYRTGDLARYVPDSTGPPLIEFAGRLDHQVKIRGFRIELGEIEATLNQHPAVQTCTVITHEDTAHDKRLVAYVAIRQSAVTSQHNSPDSDQNSERLLVNLRQFVQQKLPDYMVPTTFMILDDLPLTPNGKIDHGALPAPEYRSEAIFVAPRTATEETLAAIWGEILGLKQVGIYDNFFDLGGHSLLAMQIISRIRQICQIELPLRSLFEYPTIIALSAMVAQARQTTLPPIKPVSRTQTLPLSFTQQRLWFFNQLEGPNAIYNIPTALTFSGSLNIPALSSSLNTILQRHEVLRTTFQEVEGEARQLIRTQVKLELPLIDLRALPAPDQAIEQQRLAKAEALRSFDLSQDLMVRAQLLLLGQNEFLLFVTMHHIVSDAWSMDILGREVSQLYQAYIRGLPSPLPDNPSIQFADFAYWQRQWLQGDALAKHLAYWQKQLADAPSVMELPLDYPRPSQMSYQGAHRPFRLSAAFNRKLHILSRQAGTTLYMTLLAAFKVLLYRYSGQKDLVVGSPIANRTRPEIETLIGVFINTLALRSNLAGNPTFLELLEQVRQTTQDAYEHQDLPLEVLVEALQPERNLSHSPLFQLMFVWQNAPQSQLEFPNLRVSQPPLEFPIARFDLILTMEERDNELVGIFTYNTALWEESSIERMIDHFHNLLSNILENPSQPIAQIPLLSEIERHRLLVDWNDARLDTPQDQCLHHLFEAQVVRTPDKVALVFEDQQLTYRELNQRANRIAHDLQQLGVGPDIFVGLYVERSLEMVIGILAILKAGGAYLPLEPDWPAERLAYLTDNAGVSILLAQEHLPPPALPSSIQVVNLNRPRSTNGHNPTSPVSPDHVAYLLYTSGSTGTPKGVTVAHRQVVNYCFTFLAQCQIPAGFSYAMVQPLSVDSCISTLFPPLWTDGVLHLISRERSLTPDTLADYFQTHFIDCLKIAPSHLAALLPAPVLPRQRLIIGGEASRWDWVVELQRNTECLIFNHYGPTETTVGVLTHQIDPSEFRYVTTPIGRPLPNTQAYILDQIQQPVPIGVTGELYIGGANVARDYLNLPGMTSEKFVPDPFSSKPGVRLYKTGDLCRYRSDGTIEFLGRADHQVKIRGFRIEPGEIESVLSQHPQVQELVVVARDDRSSDKQLVAYLVSEQEPPASEDLRHYAQKRLPDYMVPAAFVTLAALPRTAHGKLNQHALPAPKPSIKQVYAPPYTPTEVTLAEIWAEVLDLHQVSTDTNFFDLGGHSLLATQIVSRIRNTFQIELPLRRLFEHPNITALAEVVARAKQATIPPIESVSRTEILPLSFAQQRLWFLNELEGPSATYNLPVALKLSGALDIPALSLILNAIVQRHEVLRTTFQSEAGEARQVIQSEGKLHLPLVDLQYLPTVIQSTEVNHLAKAEALRPFNLGQDLMIRAQLLLLGQNEYVLLITNHHIASDAWSRGVLIHEVNVLYQAYTQGLSSPLPNLSIQYADFAHWQRRWLQGDVMAAQVDYWQTQLDGIPAVLELPTDHPRPVQASFHGGRLSFTISSALSQKMRTLSRRTGTTLYMAMLTVFKVLLYRYTSQTDIVVGSPIANRTRPEIETLIGFFVNTLALRTDISGQPTFLELLDQVRQVTQEAYEHQDLPFEALIDILQPERSLSYHPLFQVMFVWQNVPQPSIELPGLSLQLLEPEFPIAKFDLLLAMQEVQGELIGTWEYNSALFEGQTIERMNDHFQTLLTALAENPSQSIAQMPLLTATERHQLLVEWNDTRTDYPLDQALHHLFEQQVEDTPDQIALVHGTTELTYNVLNNRANQLAHYLRSIGVESEDLIAIYMPRSIEIVVAILGILKASGAYVPLDPVYPQERLQFILADTQAKAVLTTGLLANDLPNQGTQIVRLDDLVETIKQQPETNLTLDVQSTQLAYIIYTSGSTGQPKGVAIEHTSPAMLVAWAKETFAAEDYAGVLFSTSVCFDLSIFEMFVPLSWGCRVILIENILDLPNLTAVNDVTLINTVPSAIAELLKSGQFPSSVRVVNLAGEPLKTQLVNEIYARTGVQKVYDLYGPSEDTTYSTFALRETEKPATIGRPIANTQAYILDQNLQMVPIGVPGELHLGGGGLARGYLHRPELTAERFIRNPFRDDPAQRLYKTGDLVRYRPDGNLEFLGRLDHQVKIRGYRIELGEIETRLAEHAAVNEVVVVVREDTPGDKRLVAYLSPDQSHSPSVSELHDFLKTKLPDYMIPATFVTLEALPLSSNGKIDRRVLPVPQPQPLANYIAPRDPIEQRLTRLWQETLNLSLISIRDSFFDMGGHSLMAVRLLAHIQQHFDQHLPLATLFQYPTIEALANLLRQQSSPEQWSSLVAIQPHGAELPFFCVPGAGSNPLYLYPLARHLGPEQPFYGLQPQGLDGVTPSHTTIEAMASYYLKAIKQAQPQGPYYLAGHSFGGKVAFELAQQLLRQGERVALLAVLDTLPFAEEEIDIIDWNEPRWLTNFVAVAEEFTGQKLNLTQKILEELNSEEQLLYIKQRLEQAAILPSQSDIAQLQGWIQIFKVNLQAALTYNARNVIPMPITLFCPDDTPSTEHERMAKAWSEIGPVNLQVSPGSHITMMAEPQVKTLAVKLRDCLYRARSQA